MHTKMDKAFSINRFQMPITTGTPRLEQQPLAHSGEEASFQDILNRKMQGSAQFSKHAASRVEQRQIQLTQGKLERLDRGIRMAEEKGLDDTLILVDQTAFLVSVKNNKIITAVGQNDLTGNVFTNIDGTVII